MERLLRNKKALIIAIVAIIAVVGIVIGVSVVSSKGNNNDTTVNPSASNEEPKIVSVKEYLPTVKEMDERLTNTGLSVLFTSGKLSGIQTDEDGMTLLMNKSEVTFSQIFSVIYEYMKDIPGFSKELENAFIKEIENGEVREAPLSVIVTSEFEFCGVSIKVDYMPSSYSKNMQENGFDKYIFYFTYGTITLGETPENLTEKEETTYLSAEELVEKLDTTFQNTVELKFEFSIEKLSGDSAIIHVKSQGNEIMHITYMPAGSVLGIVRTNVDLKALGKEVTGSIDELQYVATCVAAIPTLVVMENQGGTGYTANDWHEVSTDLVSSLKVENSLTYSSVKAFNNWELTLEVTDYHVNLSANTKD